MDDDLYRFARTEEEAKEETERLVDLISVEAPADAVITFDKDFNQDYDNHYVIKIVVLIGDAIDSSDEEDN